MKKLLALAVLIPTLAAAEWTTAQREEMVNDCSLLLLERYPYAQSDIIEYCQCASRALEAQCPDYDNAVSCATSDDRYDTARQECNADHKSH